MKKENPFIGPKSYEEGDNFFGRDTEIKEVVNLIRNETLTLLFSRSGTGKSSLIKAGLIPLLKSNYEYLPVYIHLSDAGVNENSNNGLSDYVIKRCKEEITKHLKDKTDIEIFIPELQNEHSLFEFIITVRLVQVEYQQNSIEDLKDPVEDSKIEYIIKPILIFDQFEEIFTHSFKQSELKYLISEIRCLVESQLPEYVSHYSREKIIKIQNNLISKQKKFKILFSFREEYLPQFESLRSEIPFIQFTNSRYRLEPFSKETAESVIISTDSDIKKNIAEQIVKNIAIDILPNFEKIIVEPFILSLVCQEIYYKIFDQENEFEEKVVENIKKIVDNSIYQYIKDIYARIGENTKEFIETKLITSDHKRTPYNYKEAIAIPGLETDINNLIDLPELRLLNKEEFLDSPHIEILHDRLLPPLAILRDIRQKRIVNRKRYKILIWSLLPVVLICIFFMMQYYNKSRDIKQMHMFINANDYFEKNDFRMAYGIYSNLEYKNADFLNVFVDNETTALTYTDLPGSNNIALANNKIISTFPSDSSSLVIEIWKIISKTSIKPAKRYRDVYLYAISYDGNYLAIYNKKQLILYNAQTDKDTVLLKNPDNDISFEFSQYSKYMYCYFSKSKSYIFDLEKPINNCSFYVEASSSIFLKNIAFVSATKIYNSYYLRSTGTNYFIEWNRYKDSLSLNYSSLLISKKNPWCYMQNDSLLLITSNGLEVKDLKTDAQTVLLKGDFKRFNFIRKISPNSIMLYSSVPVSKTSTNILYYTSLGFYRIGGNKLYEPFKKQLIDKISVNDVANWTNCLIRINRKDIYAVDLKKENQNPVVISTNPNTFLTDSIYDISDDSKYILYVKRNISYEKGNIASIHKGVGVTKKSDTSAYLYLCDVYKGKSMLIDELSIDPDPDYDSNVSIYANYFFRFNSNSDMITYLKKGKNGSSLIVKNIKDTATVYKSVVPQGFIDDYRRLDFTSFYIHVKNIDTTNNLTATGTKYTGNKSGVKLLNNIKRDPAYFYKLYPRDTSEQQYELKISNYKR